MINFRKFWYVTLRMSDPINYNILKSVIIGIVIGVLIALVIYHK